MSGIEVKQDEWLVENLPNHLRMNFKVLDDANQMVAQGRDLMALKHQLQDKVTESLQQVATPDIEQDNFIEWNFGELAKEYTETRGGFEIKAYPGAWWIRLTRFNQFI